MGRREGRLGSLLTETFDGPELDANLWLRPGWLVENHPNIGVKIENGHLVISGTSSGSGSHQYAGIMSKNFRDTDVVLAADMQVQSPFNGEGRIQHMVHLCNATPDFFSEIIFGKIAGNDPPCWHTAYLAKIWEYSGHGEYLQPILPPTGTEATQWHTVVLVHDGATLKSQNYLVVNGQWVPIGPAPLIRYNHTLIELKVDVSTSNLPIRMAVDNVRLYPNPAHNPAMIVVTVDLAGGRPKYPLRHQRVQIFEEDSNRLLGEGLCDEGGEACVILRSDVLYPVTAAIKVWDGATLVGRGRIPCQGLSGLYPGGVWEVYTPRRF